MAKSGGNKRTKVARGRISMKKNIVVGLKNRLKGGRVEKGEKIRRSGLLLG